MTARSCRIVLTFIVLSSALLAAPAALGAEGEDSAATPAPTVEPPKLVHFVEAEYPAGEAPSPAPVEVEMMITIGADGVVTDASAVDATGSAFETAALAAAHEFTFDPAKRNGQPIPARIRYRYVFAPPAPPLPTTGVLEGRVLGTSDEPLGGASVAVSSEDGTVVRDFTTAADGAFQFDELPAGAYQVEITCPQRLGYANREDVTAGEATALTVRLAVVPVAKEPTTEEPLEFGATATVQAPPREVTKRTLAAEELNRVAGTRGDALRAVELMPGVARPPAGWGFVIVRGAAPTDSDVQLEGASVPRLYHFGGLTSFVQGRLLDKIDLYPGNFSARYGRRLGGIIEVSLRDPKTDAWHGMADVNVIDASIFAEGPVTKNLSLLAAFRRSYIDTWFTALANSTDFSVGAAPVYYDYQLMATWRPRDADRLRVTVYGSTDNFKVVLKKAMDQDSAIRGNLGVSTAFHRVHTQWLHRFGDSVEQEIGVSAGPLFEQQIVGDDIHLDIDAFEILARAEWRVRLGSRVRLLAGIDTELTYGDVTYRGPQIPAFEGDPAMTGPLAGRELITLDYQSWIKRPAAYAELSVNATRSWQLVAGLRADYYAEGERATLDPRLVSRWELRPGTLLKAGAGLFSQGPAIPQILPDLGNPDLGPAHGQHYSAGVEQDLGVAMVSVEGFYKRLDDLIVASETPDVPLQNGGRGRIWGAEFSLKSRLGPRGFGFVSYTYSRSRRNDHGLYWRNFDFDQPHILTMSGSYRLGWGFELGGTFRYVSGSPVTPVQGSVYDGNYDLYRPVHGQIDSGRNAAFHQLDVRIEKQWKRSWGSIAAYLDVQNAYNHSSSEGRYYNYDYTQSRTVPGMPIIPSLGLRGEL